MENVIADIIVIGGGVIGCSIAYNLAKLGAKNVVILERDSIGSGGTAKSCAIVRTHYSIQANMLHAFESLKIFEDFDQIVGGQAGFHRTGYLILGPEEHRERMETVFRMQNDLGINTRILDKKQTREIHPLINSDDVDVIGFDSYAGYCDPYLTTTSYASQAKDLGVSIYEDSPVIGIKEEGKTKTVQTPQKSIESQVVILVAGPWTNLLGQMIGVKFPYVVSRHKVVTLKIGQPYQLDWPIVKDLTSLDKIYCRPETGGLLLVGTGDHGDPIEDVDSLTDYIEIDHVSRIHKLVSNRMPAFENMRYVSGWAGPYDITPDWNPLVGPVTDREGFFVAVGFSGHGFKLAPTIGESVAQTVLGIEPRIPIEMYYMDRFNHGAMLEGAYGVGSIS